MTISFSHIPQNLRVPLFYAEVDPSHANTATETQCALIIGQMNAAGTFAPNVPVLVESVSAVKAGAGLGSMLASMVEAYRANDSFGELWCLPLADDGAAIAATATITITGTTTAASVFTLYVAGQRVNVALVAGQTAAQVAAAVAAAVSATADLPVTAANVGGVITFTAKAKGLAGNDIDVRLNFLGASDGEKTPDGLNVAIVAMAGGATNPTLTAALANLQDQAFDFIVSAYTDATSIAAIRAFLDDQTGRWSWMSQLYGHAFIAKRGTVGQLSTFGNGLNDPHLTCIGFNDSPSPNWAWAAAMAGAAAVSLRADPGRPLQTLAVKGVLAPPLASRFPLELRNVLLFDGISTFLADRAGNIAIENLITTYQVNALAQPDDSYLQIETLFLLAYNLRRLKAVIATKYSRMKLADNGTRVLPGSAVVTPNIIRADLIGEYEQMEGEGYVQNSAAFAKNLIVEKSKTNPNRVNVLWPGTLINQLRVFAMLAQFRLS